MANEDPKSLLFTIVAPHGRSELSASVVIGSNRLSVYSGDQLSGTWFLVVDRRTLEVVVNVTQPFDQPDRVPPEVEKLASSNDYLLVFVGLRLQGRAVPQGALFDFLLKNGAGRDLRALVQYAEAMSLDVGGSMGYALVDVLGIGGNGFESLSFGPDSCVMALRLVQMPAQDDEMKYTPLQLQS